MSINFFTTANKEYYHFVIPYIVSILRIVPDAFVEIAVDNSKEFIASHNEKLKRLNWLGYPKYFIRDKDSFSGRIFTENSKRFIMEPMIKADIYYIGDIDIFILDDYIEHFHKLQIMRNTSCYSNVVRKGTKRLTGLHACTWEWFERTKELRETIIHDFGNDEKFLYDLADSFSDPEWITFDNKRPIHGLHLSPNRTAESTPSWNVAQYGIEFMKLINSQEGARLLDLFDDKYLDIITGVNQWYQTLCNEKVTK